MPDEQPLRMGAYYYGFSATGERSIDIVLSAVATAGKAYHHTDGWQEEAEPCPPFKGESYAEFIQNAADDAAAEMARLKVQLARYESCNCDLGIHDPECALSGGRHA